MRHLEKMKQLRFSALAIALELSGLTAISPLLIVAPGNSLAQETSEAKEGLTKGIPVPADKDLLEGTWTALHIWTKRNTWKRAGTVQIQKDEATGELLAKWTNNGGGDDPAWNQGNGAIKPQNKVEFSGTDVTLHRKLSAPDEIRPKLKRCLLNDLPRIVRDLVQPQNLPQSGYAYSFVSDRRVLLCPLVKAGRVLAFQTYAGLLQALLQRTPNFLVIAIESQLKFLLFPSLDVRD